ncbi:unnamed protein product, partial [Coregonus sp. 'balchen']
MEQIRRENPMIFNRGVALTRKLGFPDVIMPGDIRNDLYLTLERGDFERGGKSVQKNIEVTVYVLYADGEILKTASEGHTYASSSDTAPVSTGLVSRFGHC